MRKSKSREIIGCLLCQHATRREIVSETMNYVTPKGTIELEVSMPYDVCDACGHQSYGAEGERARMEAIYGFHNRLSPWEIISIRRALDQSQLEFAKCLGVGHASLERWETGEKMQNQSMNNLILLLSNPDHQKWLESQKRAQAEGKKQGGNVLELDRFRALKNADPEYLIRQRDGFELRPSQVG